MFCVQRGAGEQELQEKKQSYRARQRQYKNPAIGKATGEIKVRADQKFQDNARLSEESRSRQASSINLNQQLIEQRGEEAHIGDRTAPNLAVQDNQYSFMQKIDLPSEQGLQDQNAVEICDSVHEQGDAWRDSRWGGPE